MATVKVKPWGEGQGEFVIIEKEDFDAEKHELFEESAVSVDTEQPKKRGRPAKDAEQ